MRCKANEDGDKDHSKGYNKAYQTSLLQQIEHCVQLEPEHCVRQEPKRVLRRPPRVLRSARQRVEDIVGVEGSEVAVVRVGMHGLELLYEEANDACNRRTGRRYHPGISPERGMVLRMPPSNVKEHCQKVEHARCHPHSSPGNLTKIGPQARLHPV